MDKNKVLDYMEKVVGYNLSQSKPSEPDLGQLDQLTKAQIMLAKGKIPSKDLHMGAYIRNYQDALRFDRESGVYVDNADKENELKLEQTGEDINDSGLVTFP